MSETMKKEPMYFGPTHDEYVYPIGHWQEYADDEQEEVEIVLAQKERHEYEQENQKLREKINKVNELISNWDSLSLDMAWKLLNQKDDE